VEQSLLASKLKQDLNAQQYVAKIVPPQRLKRQKIDHMVQKSINRRL